jgi:uncharacterized protein
VARATARRDILLNRAGPDAISRRGCIRAENWLAKYAISSHFTHMWIPRTIEAKLRDLAATRPVLVLTGARQTGKTSTLRRLFPDYDFVSLDLPSEAEQAEKEPALFLQRHPPPAILDEVQYAPALFRHLKVVVDAQRHRAGQFLVTGSQKFTLMKGVSESLAGRAAILELAPLALAEVRAVRPKTLLLDFIVRGGMPELHAHGDLDVVSFQNSYLATYLERDVRTLANVGSLRDFERFLRACALRSANLLNRADLARDVGIAPSTANQWLSILEASGQVTLLEPWFSNRTKSIVKSPKLYLNDTGLLCALLNIRDAASLQTSPSAGAVWETFVLAQLRHRERVTGRERSLFFWRDRTREVDFLVEAAGWLELFEAKWTELPDATDLVNLRFARETLGRPKVRSAVVVCRARNAFPLDDGCRAVPVDELV